MWLIFSDIQYELMNLVVDIGNTRTKAGVFKGNVLIAQWVGEALTEGGFLDWATSHGVVRCIYSSVRRDVFTEGLEPLVQAGVVPIRAGTHLKHPLVMRYKSPETLGTDRLAAALGGSALFPGASTLVINAGTCLTFDMVLGGKEYIGGGIAPGLQMRLRALHRDTGRLPLEKAPTGHVPWPGADTAGSIQAGVVWGMVAEMDGWIDKWRENIGFFNVILAGGDGFYFGKMLKNRIFAHENIVLYGLNLMLEHNAQTQP